MVSAILLGGALLIGGLLAVQAAANLQLTKAVGSPYGGATVQLWVAAGLLVALTVAVGASGALGRLGDVPGWYLLGGLASPLYITSGILLFPRLGALAAGGLFVTGQMLASVALDLTGGIGVPLRPVGVGVVVGSAAVLAGMLLVVRGAPVPRAAASFVRSAAARRRRWIAARRRTADPRWAGCCSGWPQVPRSRCRARSTLACARRRTSRSRSRW